jgi:hypothetical protein
LIFKTLTGDEAMKRGPKLHVGFPKQSYPMFRGKYGLKKVGAIARFFLRDMREFVKSKEGKRAALIASIDYAMIRFQRSRHKKISHASQPAIQFAINEVILKGEVR